MTEPNQSPSASLDPFDPFDDVDMNLDFSDLDFSELLPFNDIEVSVEVPPQDNQSSGGDKFTAHPPRIADVPELMPLTDDSTWTSGTSSSPRSSPTDATIDAINSAGPPATSVGASKPPVQTFPESDNSKKAPPFFPHKEPSLGNQQASLPSADLDDAKPPAAVSDPDAGRKMSPVGYLLVTEADGIINTLFTKEDQITKGTTAWRRSVKGTRRRRKIPDEYIEQEAARIRLLFSQKMKKQYQSVIHANSNQGEPTLMVEEKRGIDPKKYLDTKRYYCNKTGKFCRRASDYAIAKAWSEPSHREQRSLEEEVAELEQDLNNLRLANSADETFDARANVVQDLINVFKPNPFSNDPRATLPIGQVRHKNIVAMLEKTLEELKPKKAKRQKKRSRDSSSGNGDSSKQQRNSKKKDGGNHPSNHGHSSETHFEGEGTADGPQGSMPDASAEWDGSDYESVSSKDLDQSDGCSSGEDSDGDDDGTGLVLETHQLSLSDGAFVSAGPPHSSMDTLTMAMEKTTLEDASHKLTDWNESTNPEICDDENIGGDAGSAFDSYHPNTWPATSTNTEPAVTSSVVEKSTFEESSLNSINEGAASLSETFRSGPFSLSDPQASNSSMKLVDKHKTVDEATVTTCESSYYSLGSKTRSTNSSQSSHRDPITTKVVLVREDCSAESAQVENHTIIDPYGDIGQNTDRIQVVDRTVVDPYGDKGLYTGMILCSTGMPHGQGRMLYEDNRAYNGEWRHGRWHGFGRAAFATGDSYEGEYRFDQRHGRGRYEWHDGRRYDGNFREDHRHGYGTFTWPDGAVYRGSFRNGNREGHGMYQFSDGGRYEGNWKDGKYSGFGVCHWEDGRTYKGQWVDGMAHGMGVETFPDGSVRHDGQWIEDEPVVNET